jgi:hypothetical protein
MAYIRRCKYGCETQLRDFDETERKYKEHPSGILHTKERCTEAKKKLESQPKQPLQNKVVDQDQKTKDIKDAQQERRDQHRELIKNMQWNTKMLALRAEQEGGHGTAGEILEEMGFEEFREEQRQEGYEDL